MTATPSTQPPRIVTGPGMLVIPGPEETRAQERAEERRQLDTLTATLRDIRALVGAEETVFFRYTRARETIEAAAWSAPQGPSDGPVKCWIIVASSAIPTAISSASIAAFRSSRVNGPRSLIRMTTSQSRLINAGPTTLFLRMEATPDDR